MSSAVRDAAQQLAELKSNVRLQIDNEIEALNKDIREHMHTHMRVTPAIEFVPPNTFERATHKSQYVIKNYEDKKKGDDVVEVHHLKNE